MAKLNLQNMPKTQRFLECFTARPGNKLVAMDFAALEPKVLTYFSRDPNLLRLYGPDAVTNDVYLFNGAKIAGLGERILATGYNPDHPTPEHIARAKEECKLDRQIAKKFTLSSNYGAGPGKIHSELLIDGIEVTLQQCKQYYAEFWMLYAGIKEFESDLVRQYHTNGGWIYNATKRPLGIDGEKIKDIINRFVQSSGHDLLWVFVRMVLNEMSARGLDCWEFIVDYHDETILEVPEGQVQSATQVFLDMTDKFNDMIGWDVRLDGDVDVGDTLADVKKPEK